MAVIRPITIDGSGNIIELTDTQINEIKARVMYLYGTDPSVTLTVPASGGNLGGIFDNRKTAGASTTDVTDFDTAAETPNVSAVSQTYSSINLAAANTTASPDTNSIGFPCFLNGTDIQAMTLADMNDTFVYPVIDDLIDGTDRPGTFRIHTANTLANHTLISSTPVFTDTRADASAYTDTTIPEDVDQPITINNYYLFRTNGTGSTYTAPVFITATDYHIQQYSITNFDALLLNCVRHVASEDTSGYKIRYRYNAVQVAGTIAAGAGNDKGSAMVNSYLGGSTYNTHQVNSDDYRTQEFPAGTVVTGNIYSLRIHKE